MRFSFEIFVRSRTVYSDWAYFVLPERLKENKPKVDLLSRVMSAIYEDNELEKVTETNHAFYCFPLEADTICMRVRRAKYKDVSARAIWDFVGVVIKGSDEMIFKKALPSIIDFGQIYAVVEENYLNQQDFAPNQPAISRLFDAEINLGSGPQTVRLLNKAGDAHEWQAGFSETDFEVSDHFLDEQPEFRARNIVVIPYDEAGNKQLLQLVRDSAENRSMPLAYISHGPGSKIFIDGEFLKQLFRRTERALISPTQTEITASLQKVIDRPDLEICEISVNGEEGIQGVLKFIRDQFYPSKRTWVVQIRDTSGRKKIIYKTSDQVDLERFIETGGWKRSATPGYWVRRA